MTTVAESSSTVQFAAALRAAAARACTRYAGEAARIDRGLVIALNGGVTLLADGTAQVRSASDPEVVYAVNGHCDCSDVRRAPDGRCKHRWAKSLATKATKAVDAEVRPTHCPNCFVPFAPDEAARPGEVCAVCALNPELSPREGTALAAPARPTIAPEHLVEIQDKQFVKFAGLLQLAHARGLTALTVIWTYNDPGLSLAQAVAVFPFGTFTEAGDATPENVTRKVAPHFRRVALTRAKARALRDALNVDMVAYEELGE